MNVIFLFLVISSTICAALYGNMEPLTQATFEAAKGAVELAIGLIGVMALWLGVMKVAEEAGLLTAIARGVYPAIKRLFPEIPRDHPAVSAMVMNIAANMLGLGNAATPLGIKAMQELNTLNPQKESATNAMCLFLAINTSNVTLLPLGVIAVRAAAGAKDPASIIIPTLFATTISTLTAICVSLLIRRIINSPTKNEMKFEKQPLENKDKKNKLPRELHSKTRFRVVASVILALSLLVLLLMRLTKGPLIPALKNVSSYWLIPYLMSALLLYGFGRGVNVYEVAVNGAKEGFDVAVKIIPFLVMILVGVSMFRASGAFGLFVQLVSPITSPLGFPPEVLPVALIRPLSGSGAFGLMSEIVRNAPDSFNAFLASTLQGSTETTFYVLAVYFGAVGIRNYRYALIPALSADVAGALAALFICKAMF